MIDTSKSSFWLKNGEVVVNLIKVNQKKWDSLEYQKPKETPKIDKNEDP